MPQKIHDALTKETFTFSQFLIGSLLLFKDKIKCSFLAYLLPVDNNQEWLTFVANIRFFSITFILYNTFKLSTTSQWRPQYVVVQVYDTKMDNMSQHPPILEEQAQIFQNLELLDDVIWSQSLCSADLLWFWMYDHTHTKYFK